MGVYCCKDEQEITELDDYNIHTYGNNQKNNEDIFKTRAPCLYGYQCSCPCHRAGQCVFQLKAK